MAEEKRAQAMNTAPPAYPQQEYNAYPGSDTTTHATAQNPPPYGPTATPYAPATTPYGPTAAPYGQPTYNPQYYQPTTNVPQQQTFYVQQAVMGGPQCSNCHQMTMQERYECAPLVCIIVLAFFWFPIGLCYLFMLDKTKCLKCANCGHVGRPANGKPIYITAGICFVVWIIVVAAGIAVRVNYATTCTTYTQYYSNRC